MSFSLDDLKKKKNEGLVLTGSQRTQQGLAVMKNQVHITKKDDIDSKMQAMTKNNLAFAAKQLKEGSTEVIFILDKSRSCSGLEEATSQGFINFVNRERKTCFPTKVTTILFDEKSTVVHDNADITQVDGLNYVADGAWTALYSTFCRELPRIENRQKASGQVPKNTIVVIMTDGKDNASEHFLLSKAKSIIAHCKSMGWQFIFMGANIDAGEVALELGISLDNSVGFINSRNGLLANFEAANLALESLRSKGKIDSNWSDPIKKSKFLALGEGKKEIDKTLRLGGRR